MSGANKGRLEYLPIDGECFSDLGSKEKVFYRDPRDEEFTEPVRAVVMNRKKLETVVDTRLPGKSPVDIDGRPGVVVRLKEPYNGRVPERQFREGTDVLAQPGALLLHYSVLAD